MRSWFLAIAFGVSAVACGGGGGGSATPDSSSSSGQCPASVTTGTACSAVGDCLTLDRSDCSETVSCHCDGTHYTCEGVADGSSCAAFGGAATCSVEGTATCDTPPAGGSCNCGSDGTWQCVDACPAGCPSTQPAAGSTCTLPSTVKCPYGESNRTCCTCGSDGSDGSGYECGGCDSG